MADAKSLFIVRHAIAGERGPEFPDDARRPLTEEGIARFRKVVAGLAEMEIEIDLVLTSPLVRARQTAELLSKGLPGHPGVVETGALAPGATFDAVATELRRHARRGALALVGHEPHLGGLTARLLGCQGEVEFRKGGVCRLEVDKFPPSGPARLLWLAPPKLLIRARRPR